MLICGVDFETTGLSSKDNRIIEVGAVLWDTDAHAPVRIFSELVDPEQPVSSEITKITGITQAMINGFSQPEPPVLITLLDIMSSADFIVAHNAPFDRAFLQEACFRNHIAPPKKVWIDSSTDVPYPESIQTRKLTHLAAEHGFVNPFAHRAVTDVLTMLMVVDRYNWREISESAQQPSVTVKAEGGYAIKDLAKECGFRYNGDKKAWFKTLKLNKLESERARCAQKGLEISEQPNEA